MANDITGDRLWTLTDVAVLAAVNVPVRIRMIQFFPTTAGHSCTFQEYSSAAVLRTAAYLLAGPVVAEVVTLDFGDKGRGFNGLKLSAISAGSVYVYLL